MTEPLSRAFNAAVVGMANRCCPAGYDVAAEGVPSTLVELNSHLEKTGRMLVWSGKSNSTIFACPETNWAFRAWHDWTHWRYKLDMTDADELRVLDHQKAHLLLIYGPGRLTDLFYSLLDFEVAEQIDFKNTFGHFPDDQMGLAVALGYPKVTAAS